MNWLCITVRFLHSAAHGRGDGGEPEWPPSPLRLFQALVAAAAGRWNERQIIDYAVPALKSLESLDSPQIVAPNGIVSDVRTQFYVPDNTIDLCVPSWKRGEVDKSAKRTEKVVRTTHLSGDAVHYLFPLPPEGCPYLEVLRAAARSITHLGWGIDMAVGNADVITEAESAKLPGHRWRAVLSGGVPLRVPILGTLDALMAKHQAFLGRLSDGGFKPVPPLSTFTVVHYLQATDTPARPWCAFAILKPDASGNQAFDTPRRASHVAAWLRRATGEVCAHWPDLASFVHGHSASGQQAKGEEAEQRFQYLPLPTINAALKRTEAIRRVLIAAPPGYQDRIDFIRRRLPGQELIWEERAMGLLNILPTSDWVLKQYTGRSRAWSTVTPVIWPGYDDRDSRKAEKLLRKAFLDAGLAPELVNAIEGDDLEWRQEGFRAGLDRARNYTRPDKLTGSMYHVRVRFAHPVRGPLVIGAGRYRGFGLFAIDDPSP